MAVLAEARKADRDALAGDLLVKLFHCRRGIALAIDRNEARRILQRGHEALAQIAPEARRMALGQADIFVEMEGRDLRPVDALGHDEMVQHLELAGAGRHDDRRRAMAGELVPDRLRAKRRRLPAELVLVGGEMHLDHRILNLLRQKISDILEMSL